jgi:Ca2+-binding EF-hand superfamily protein
MNRTMIASVAALLATSSLAFAAYAHGEGKGLARFDRDGNGVVTRSEMRTTESERFDKIDTNHDGQLSGDEIQAAHREAAAKHFAAKDTDKDGKLSRAEVAKMPDAMFARIDANKDGFLTPDELAQAHQGHGQKGFLRADTNGDGTISRDEALAHSDKRFARLDTNGDGVITQEEAKAAHHHGQKDGAPSR